MPTGTLHLKIKCYFADKQVAIQTVFLAYFTLKIYNLHGFVKWPQTYERPPNFFNILEDAQTRRLDSPLPPKRKYWLRPEPYKCGAGAMAIFFHFALLSDSLLRMSCIKMPRTKKLFFRVWVWPLNLWGPCSVERSERSKLRPRSPAQFY